MHNRSLQLVSVQLWFRGLVLPSKSEQLIAFFQNLHFLLFLSWQSHVRHGYTGDYKKKKAITVRNLMAIALFQKDIVGSSARLQSIGES